MIKEAELYTQTIELPLMLNNHIYGTSVARYQVRQVTDVRNLRTTKAYRVTCLQRIIIPNADRFSLEPKSGTAFVNYPALLSSRFTLATTQNASFHLVDYSPRTVNTTVMSSGSQGKGDSSSFSQQHTSGSSVSQTNSYGMSFSDGTFGDADFDSLDLENSVSFTAEENYSNAIGSDSGKNRQQESSDSMSIKDWGSYAYIDPGNKSPTWVWGQEYPWDLIQYRYCPNGNEVALPKFVLARLFDNSEKPNQAFPPSQLSLFGIDFCMKATWLVELPDDLEHQSVEVQHHLEYLTASHGIQKPKPGDPPASQDQIFVTLNPIPVVFEPKPVALDLTLLGLDPIRHGRVRNGAIIGFISSKFIVPPVMGEPFKIISDSNTLQITGRGFEAPLSTDFSRGPVTLKIQFKIIDTSTQYAIFFKHWKTTANGCTLTLIFNHDKDATIVQRVDAKEGEGGTHNLNIVTLRDTDYTSIDYHDYLVIGLNTIDVIITPDEADQPAGYLLRTIAIGER